MTSCARTRRSLSAALDGEPVRDRAAVDRHLAGCADCRAWESTARLLAAAPVAPADVPDLTGPVLAGYRAAQRQSAPEPWLRWSLVLVAVVQLAVAMPGLLTGGASGVAHATRDLSAWDAAFAIGLLYAARRPDRATGLLPFAAALAGVLAFTSFADVVAGRVPALTELPHLLALFGLALLWQLTHPRAPHAGPRRDRTRHA